MTDITVGLCSVSFRSLDYPEIIDQAAKAGLEAIEWGSDVHILPGAVDQAHRIRDACMSAGITCSSYGTYFEAGVSPPEAMLPLLASATALGATSLRIWAGLRDLGSADYGRSEFVALVSAIRRATEMAADAGLTLATEFHRGRFTDTAPAVLQLLEAVDHPALKTYWQWEPQISFDAALDEIRLLAPGLLHLHAFNWDADGTRHPLAAQPWTSLIATTSAHPADRCIYLEFLPGDDIAMLPREAATLREAVRLSGFISASPQRSENAAGLG